MRVSQRPSGHLLAVIGLLAVGLTLVLAPARPAVATGCATPATPPTVGTTYEISTLAHLEWLRAGNTDTARLAQQYVLAADLDLTGCVWTEGIADSTAFTGTFDGNGHRIDHLTVDNQRPTGNVRAGLFGSANQPASITGLSVSGTVSAISTSTSAGTLAVHAGGIIGFAHTATLSGLHFSGSVHADSDASTAMCATGTCAYEVLAGGIAGEAAGSATGFGVSDVTVSASGGDDVFAGGVIGRLASLTELHTVTVARVHVTTSSRAISRAGGVAGSAFSGRIRSIVVDEAVVDSRSDRITTASVFKLVYAGGVVGDHVAITAIGPTDTVEVSRSTISAFTDRPVSASLSRAFAGGLAGDSDFGFHHIRVADTDVAAEAQEWAHAGGITGWLTSDDTVEEVMVSGTVSARVPATSSLSGSRAAAGGVTGYDNPVTWSRAPRAYRVLRVDGSISASMAATGVNGVAEAGGLWGVGANVAPADVLVTGAVDATAVGAQATASSGGLGGRAWNFEPARSIVGAAVSASGALSTAHDPVLGTVGGLGTATVSADVFWHAASTAPATNSIYGTEVSFAQLTDRATYTTFALADGWETPGVNVWGRCTWDPAPVPFLLFEYTATPCTNLTPPAPPPPAPPSTTEAGDAGSDDPSATDTTSTTAPVAAPTTDTVPPSSTIFDPDATLPATGSDDTLLWWSVLLLGAGSMLVTRGRRPIGTSPRRGVSAASDAP